MCLDLKLYGMLRNRKQVYPFYTIFQPVFEFFYQTNQKKVFHCEVGVRSDS